MKEFRRLAVIVPAVLLCVLIALLYVGRSTMDELANLHQGQAGESGLVDQRPFQTAQTLAALAVSAEEQGLAREAEQLADHEIDQAFATALREATMRPHTLNADAAQTARKVDNLKALVAEDKARVDALTTVAAKSGVAAAAGDDLDVAKAQLGLDSDELTDAVSDLARESGDQRERIKAELEAYDAATKKFDAEKVAAVVAVRHQGALAGLIKGWLAQRTRIGLLVQAEHQATADGAGMAREHDAIERQNGQRKQIATGRRGAAPVGSAMVQALQTMAAEHVVMSILDDRQQTQMQLASVYRRWQTQVWLEHRIVRYLILQAFAWIVFLALAGGIVIVVGRKLICRMIGESRRANTTETVFTVAVEGLTLTGILLVVFGVPQQMPTILGFAGAGLTVVFQDFILGFFGWFVLMGRNGIRVCDFVEINGIGGEVSEIGLFRTTLLETGNWTSRGHPTGRRITLINSFAIRGQFFNFSTHGQWMWDELKLTVTSGAVAYELLQAMQAAVEAETATDTATADAEWRKASGGVAVGQFSADPTVNLRPAGAAMDVVVRFMTRAPERFERRNRLYDLLTGILRDHDAATLPGSAA